MHPYRNASTAGRRADRGDDRAVYAVLIASGLGLLFTGPTGATIGAVLVAVGAIGVVGPWLRNSDA